MAEGRMIKKEIANSKKLGKLRCRDKARVMYFMILPHLDIKGRHIADPALLKGQTMTMLEYSHKTIQAGLEALHEVGLIKLYTVNGEQYVEYTRFSDFQKLYPSREAESKIPGPTLEDSGELRRTPGKEKLIKVKLSKVKLSKEKFKAPTLSEIIEYIKKNKYEVDAKRFFDYYTESDWHDREGRSVRNWKQKVITWSGRGKSNSKKTKLPPIIGKTCSKPGCPLPAVYKDTSGDYDRFDCAEHMPDEVKEKYV